MAKVAPGSPNGTDEASLDIVLPPCDLQKEPDPKIICTQEQISVVNAFSGATVLITGVTGFVGSVTLELLLRACPDVSKVVLLIRSKAGRSGEDRLDHLLGKQLFQVHCAEDGKLPATLRRKLQVVEGDISQDGCSLSAADASLIRSQVTYVIHCAASISFFEHIHALLDQNYRATKHLANLAADAPRLRAFVHVSTAYVNAHQPKGSHVEEALYPLRMHGSHGSGGGAERLSHAAVAAKLAALPAAKAERQAHALLRGCGMPNNYTLTKHMTEHLLDDLCAEGKLRVAIVRPSIISGLAHGPVPGYCGNAAGFTSASIAFASGMARFSCHDPRSVYDLVPCDTVASAILLAAAAASQQAAGAGGPALILHAASGMTNPASFAYQFERIILPYWQAEPPTQRLTCKAYKSIWAKNSWLPEDSLTFKRLRLKQGLRLRVMALALRMAGHARVADRLMSGWKVWKLYNTSTMDFNLFFCCASVRRLHALLPEQERGLIRPLWQAPEDDWHAYLTACMDAVRAKYFPKPACAAGKAPHSSRSTKGSEAQSGKIIVAQAPAVLQREDTAHITDASHPDVAEVHVPVTA